MANRSNPRRSRKRRSARARAQREPGAAALAGGATGQPQAADAKASKPVGGPRSSRRERAAGARAAGSAPAGAVAPARVLGERPLAPWHPLPLSEILILAGAIGAVIGLRRGVSHGGAPLFAGLAAVVVGTVEVTLREHLSGYRSHTLILALLPVVVLHSLIVLGLASFTRPPRALTVGLLLVDVALAYVFFRLLRARFLDARRERTLGRR